MIYFSEKEIFVTKICCGKEQLMALNRDNKVYTCNILHVEGNVYKPEIVRDLVGNSIIDIAAIKDRSFERYYAKSRDGQHFLWG